MRTFIFVTSEGSTYQPNSDSSIPDIENMQVLGFATGANEEEALANLLDDNNWLRKSSFDIIVCFELKHPNYQDHSKSFSIKLTSIVR